MGKKLRLVMVLMLLTGILLTACGGDEAASEGSQSAEAEENVAVSTEESSTTSTETREISIAPITASAEKIGVEDVVTFTTDVTGDNIAYIYMITSYYDEDSNSYLTANVDYIGTNDVIEIDGVYYPDWGSEGVVHLELDWEPVIYYLSDGNVENEQFALFEPTSYSPNQEDDIYSVYGVYTAAGGSEEIDALIEFGGDQLMRDVYTVEDHSSIAVQPGDTFTVLEEWYEFDENPDGEFVDYLGGTIAFSEEPFVMQAYYADPGSYILSILVEDMDGNFLEEFSDMVIVE